jgi:hypothetical protein
MYCEVCERPFPYKECPACNVETPVEELEAEEAD